MSNEPINIAEMPAGQPTGGAEALSPETTQEATEKATDGDVGVYKHTFKRPFAHSGTTYTELTFDFEKLTGRDMVSIETEMQMNNEYALAPEISRNFQSKLAAKAAGIGTDVIEAMRLPDFNRITNAARDFLLNSGY